MAGGPTWALIGRAAELELITKARADGRPGVVIHGPSGVGKSRLARDVLADAERGGAVVAWVQATRSATGLALGAFASLMPSGVRSDDPFELMQRGVAALRDFAQGASLVLAVDDAQWLDPTSATLVLQLTLTGTVFVVATVRSHEPCPDAVVSLWKDAGAHRIELGLLSQPHTEALAEQIVGGPIDRGTLHWIWSTSRGNALYVRELVLGAMAGGALERMSGLWRLPVQPPVSASLSELVSARMAGLSEREQRAMDLLALGEPLRLSEMLALVGGDALTSAEDRGLVRVDGMPAQAEVRLAHPLYGEVIRTALRPLRARAVRAQLVEVVQARESPDPQDPLRLARWLIEDSQPISTALAVHAARAANHSGDPDFGATLAAQALDSGGGVEAALLLARAHTVRSRFAEAEKILTAAESAIDTQDAAVDYLEQQSEVLHWGLKRPSELRALLDRAVNWWDDATWQRRVAPLRLRVASFERLGFDVTASTQILAADHVDDRVRDQVEPVHVANLFYSGRTNEARQLARRIRPMLPLQTLNAAIALSLGSRIALETGDDWPELDEWMTVTLTAGVRLADHAAAGQAAYTLACLRQSAGRHLDAAALLAEAEVQLTDHDPVGLLPVVTAMQLELAAQGDDVIAIRASQQQVETRLGEAEPLAHQLPYVLRARAWAVCGLGDPARAQRLLLDAASELALSPVHGARMLYEALRAGAPARKLVVELHRQRVRCDARLVAAYARHAAARAADDGPDLLQTADEFERIGALRYATEAAAHAADAFARHGRDDSARRAAVRARDLHSRGNGAPAPVMSELDNAAVTLTARERQLTQLAAQGLTNVEIAERLVLSVRTVESHLYRAMQKLGITDRRDLRP